MQCNEMQFCRTRLHNALNCEVGDLSQLRSDGSPAGPPRCLLLGAPRWPPPSPGIRTFHKTNQTAVPHCSTGRNQAGERWRNMLAAGFDLRLFTSLTDCHEPDTPRSQARKKERKRREERKIQMFTNLTELPQAQTISRPCRLQDKLTHRYEFKN